MRREREREEGREGSGRRKEHEIIKLLCTQVQRSVTAGPVAIDNETSGCNMHYRHCDPFPRPGLR